MKCKYCGTKVRQKEEVCNGCSAPVPTVNHAAGWGFFFALLGFLFSVLPILNTGFLILSLIFAVIGLSLAKKRNGKGRVLCIVTFILCVLGIAATAILVLLYRMQYDQILELCTNMLPSEQYHELVRKLLDIITLRVFGL